MRTQYFIFILASTTSTKKSIIIVEFKYFGTTRWKLSSSHFFEFNIFGSARGKLTTSNYFGPRNFRFTEGNARRYPNAKTYLTLFWSTFHITPRKFWGILSCNPLLIFLKLQDPKEHRFNFLIEIFCKYSATSYHS